MLINEFLQDKMIIILQNAANYDVKFPKDCVFRINLAWCNSLDELKDILKKHEGREMFIDLPIDRIKPPNNRYSLNELIPIIWDNEQIKYFAVSNVETANDLTQFHESIPERVTIVPKIESPKDIQNIQEITDALNCAKKYVMLDHDIFFQQLSRIMKVMTHFKIISRNWLISVKRMIFQFFVLWV